MGIIAIPFGYVMKLCYMLLKNYGLALILFTLITKLLMFPLSVKQQKQSVKTMRLQPKLEKLKKKYGKDKNRLNEEMTKLYAEEGVSMTGGCLPLILNFVLLFAMIEIIYAPITYITDAPKSEVREATNLVQGVMNISTELKNSKIEDKDTFSELIEVEGVQYVVGENLDAKQLEENKKAVEKITNYILDKDNKSVFKRSRKLEKDVIEDAVIVLFENKGLDEYFADGSKVPSGLMSRPELLIFNIVDAGKGDFLPQSVIEASEDINYNIFGIFLGNMPSWSNILVFIPILSLVSQLVLTFVSQRFNKRNNPSAQMGMGGMNIMLYTMPLISFWIAFTFPAGVGIYWIAQSVFGLAQTVILNLYYTPKRIEEMDKKAKAKRKQSGKKTFMEKALEAQMQAQEKGGVKKSMSKSIDDEDDEVEEEGEKKLSKSEIKELQRQRLNEARKRMAEKYGDEYIDD